MTLVKYKQKRNFRSTEEPAGQRKKSKAGLIFVVQEHAATQLHYDFRLELDGVLKSWAVPKGPSMNPDDKRLAIMVEDHPFDYKDFEGNIPKGNYGAGNVIIWDYGTYMPINSTDEDREKKLRTGLRKGHISFLLQGKKLKGEFSLVKMTGKQDDAWLLIKKNDKYASEKNILDKNKSVVSSATIKSLKRKEKNENLIEKNKITKKKGFASGSTAAGFIEPMLAEIITRPFDDKNWVFEIKYDGYRTIAVINKRQADLFSRNHLSYNQKFKVILDELKNLNHIAVLDGEVVVEDKSGRSDFQLLQNYQKTGKGNIKYYVFDIMNLDGNDTRNLRLLERKELVKMLIDKQFDNVHYSEHFSKQGKAFFEVAIKNNLEGIMAKESNSPYRSGRRSGEWLKIKNTQEEEAIIVGITGPKGSRRYFGAILLAQYHGKNLKYIGNCGTGFDEDTLKELYSKFQPYFKNSSPVTDKLPSNEKVQWIKPKFVCQVRFTERTRDGNLRQPVFLGLRKDKNVKDVTVPDTRNNHDQPDKINEEMDNRESTTGVKDKNDFDLKIGKVNLHLTNQKKVYFPDDGITKGDIVTYYKEVADTILPYLKNRPQSLNRFPNGINGSSFFQKDVDVDKIPSWLKTKKIYSESNKGYIDYLLCNDTATLLYMANLGCIEVNPWSSTIKSPENPDWMVIDLDPEQVEFKKVAETAIVIKKILDRMEVECYCKTSGSRGLHIYVPLAARYDYETVKLFAKFIATNVNQEIPESTSITRQVQKRQHKIYLDYLQNNHGQTLVAPYSVRPRPGATVSAPLEWNEVNKTLSPDQFTIKTILKRLEKKGDLWKPVLGKGVNLNRFIKNLE